MFVDDKHAEFFKDLRAVLAKHGVTISTTSYHNTIFFQFMDDASDYPQQSVQTVFSPMTPLSAVLKE